MTIRASVASEQLIDQIKTAMTLVYHGDANAMRVAFTEMSLFGAPIRLNSDGLVEMQMHGDSYQATSTPYERDDLKHLLSEVLKKNRTKLQAKEIFRTNNEVPPGATSWRAKRIDYSGTPRPLDEGGNADDASFVTLNGEREDFPVMYYVLGMRMNYMERLASENMRARINVRAEKIAGQRDSMDRFTDGLIWNDPYGRVRTVFDNDWIAEYLPSTVFKTQGDAIAMYSVVLTLVNTPSDLHNAEEGDSPTLLATSPRVVAAMRSTHLDEDSKYTVYQAIIEQTSIERIISVSALAGIGPDGTDGMAAVDPDTMEIMNVLEPTAVPEERNGLVYTSYMVAGHGGLKMLNTTNHARAYIKWESSFLAL